MYRSILVAAALAVVPASLDAQVSVGGGAGVTASPALSGAAWHGQAAVALVRLSPVVELRAEGFYQRGTVDGSPFACTTVETRYCLGREDRNQIAGVGAGVRIDMAPGAILRPYVPLGLGVYHRRTVSTESQGPAAICGGPDALEPCPDNPPFATFEQSERVTTLGGSVGIGVDAAVGRGRVFAEMRLHQLLEPGDVGAVPFTVGFTL